VGSEREEAVKLLINVLADVLAVTTHLGCDPYTEFKVMDAVGDILNGKLSIASFGCRDASIILLRVNDPKKPIAVATTRPLPGWLTKDLKYYAGVLD
jgi:hypothetical protein